MKRSILILVIIITLACNREKTFSKAILKNKAGVEYCAILPNIRLEQNVEITQAEIEKIDSLVSKSFDSIVSVVELKIGQKSGLKLDAYKLQYIPSINKENHLIINVNGLSEPEEYDWKNTIYSGGGGGQRIFTGEFDLETGKGILAFNGAL
ncbi:MAG: hypothetical protein RL705_500 [Bacteroidota bacterium]|jgi:hypothetical protein